MKSTSQELFMSKIYTLIPLVLLVRTRKVMRNAIHVVSAIDSNTPQEQEGHQTSAVTTAASQQYHNCRTAVAVHHSCRTATATSAAPAVQRKARAVFQTHSTKSN